MRGRSRHQEAPSSSAGLRALPRPVAVAVGGGGVLGAAHVGVGHALEQRGFVPDLVVGTSMGAFTGAIAAAHPGKAAPWLDDVWIRLRRREVFPLVVVLPTGVKDWPAPWDFRHSGRLISTASHASGRFLDGLRVSGPGLYREGAAPVQAAGVGR